MVCENASLSSSERVCLRREGQPKAKAALMLAYWQASPRAALTNPSLSTIDTYFSGSFEITFDPPFASFGREAFSFQ